MKPKPPAQWEPKPGDLCEIRVPGRYRKVKEIDRIIPAVTRSGFDAPTAPWVWWKRQPKGRYSGMWLSRLKECGRLISTQAQRDRVRKGLP